MKRMFVLLPLAALLLAPLTGCSRLHYAAGPQKPVLANNVLNQPHRVTSQFRENGRRVYCLWGLVPIAGYDGSDLIAARINQGDGIVNLSANERFTLLDQIIGLLTVGLISSRTFEVRGDVITWTTEAPVIVPPQEGTTVIVPPSSTGGAVVVPPQEGTVVVPPSGGTVVVP